MQRHFVPEIVVSHFIDHSLTDQEAEAAGTQAELFADIQVRERIAGDRGVGQCPSVEARPLVANHDFQAVIENQIGDVDQAIRLMQVAPLDGVMGHLHDRLAELHHLVVRQRRRLADQHQEIVQVFEEVDLAVELDMNFPLKGPAARCSHASRGRR